MGYYYYDTPEGKDCDKKLLFATKNALGASMVFSVYDVLFQSQIKGYGPTAARFAYNAFPFVGAAAAFTSIACLGTSLRKKNDYWAYMLGGAAAGGVVGAWRMSLPVGLACAAGFSVVGFVMKTSVDEDWEFFPTKTSPQLSQVIPLEFKNDSSLMKTRIQPQWTTK